MAVTRTLIREGASPSGSKRVVYTIAGDSNYPDNGWAVTFPDVSTIDYVEISEGGTTTTTGQFKADYDRAAGKIVVRDLTNSGAQPTTNHDLSNITWRAVVIGLE